MEITRVTRKSTAIKEVRLSPKGKYGGGVGTSSLEISKQISYVLEELNELFRENCSEFLTAGDLVFWKHFPAAGYLDTSLIRL